MSIQENILQGVPEVAHAHGITSGLVVGAVERGQRFYLVLWVVDGRPDQGVGV